MNGSLPPGLSVEALKEQAGQLRARRSAEGEPITHSKSLELLAHHYGYKDWNTLRAAVRCAPPPCPVARGATVRGRYLGQAFEGEVIDLRTLEPPGRFRITLRFDEPVDVVTFDSFSNLRQRVCCTIDSAGKTEEKTSDGKAHLQLAL